MMEIKPTTSLIEPFGVQFDLAAGIMQSPADPIVRRASEMRGYYADAAALERLIADENDPVHYETFESPVPEQYGHIRYGLSKLHPGLVGDECFMTKGHYHSIVETGEVYLCLRGQGLTMMKTAGGECRWEPMTPGRMVYVPPYWAHRSVNTGDEPLISLYVYPADAGHNYGDIKTEGFPKRVFKRNGRIVV
ncbi:MAG TPA: glucose-6-phosphate isomerase family protein [Candidatus Anammoximicrobium sp.]|nr:glucose-6-phosphate isomerase family protein [Candidatus Anammoximicrobium sp.]